MATTAAMPPTRRTMPADEPESPVRNDVVPPTLGSSTTNSVESPSQSVTFNVRGKSSALNWNEDSVVGPMQRKSAINPKPPAGKKNMAAIPS